jgi:hypothetical protein
MRPKRLLTGGWPIERPGRRVTAIRLAYLDRMRLQVGQILERGKEAVSFLEIGALPGASLFPSLGGGAPNGKRSRSGFGHRRRVQCPCAFGPSGLG